MAEHQDLNLISTYVRIHGASMVHSLKLDAGIKLFRDYAEKKVIPFIQNQLATAKRVDVIRVSSTGGCRGEASPPPPPQTNQLPPRLLPLVTTGCYM